jgi:predicted Zn-dependent protease
MRLISILFALLILSGCAVNPVTGKTDFVIMSESQEVAMGRATAAKISKRYPTYQSEKLQNYVNKVGQKLARQSHRPHLEYHFTVVDSPEINAFALLGGYIYITRGILAYLNSEADLAAVLGHEIGHVTARHGVRQQSSSNLARIGMNIFPYLLPGPWAAGAQTVTSAVGGAILSGYGREHELEADRLGADYLAKSSYDPRAIIRVIRVLKNQSIKDGEISRKEGRAPRRYHGLFVSHPDHDTRLQQAISEAAKQTVSQPYKGRDIFLRMTDGLVFNDNTDQGIVRNNRFYHAGLGLAINFPESWQLHNQPDSLVAVGPQGAAQIQLQVEAKPRTTPAQYARQLAGPNARIRALKINGLSAAIIKQENTISAIIYLNNRAYLLRGEAQTSRDLLAYRGDIFSTLHSFRALVGEERQLIKPLLVRVITAQKGDTFTKLARHSPLGASAESYLRLINAMYPDGEPIAGQALKIVQ